MERKIGLFCSLAVARASSHQDHQSIQSIKHAQRQIYKKEKGKNQRPKARQRYARNHLKVSRQRNEHAKRIARNLCKELTP
ncbi:hypothetical protein A2T98_17515 [Nodularia spumigena CENA596]|jgi:transposase|uniref:Transposase n=1 Tax=Nodularia spumigena CENA596 TaxID=1819295 RepID=A0A166IKC8_NODSP|nr:hypothetical protein A2T98_17515 [Nodularia spumigena CENA596]